MSGKVENVAGETDFPSLTQWLMVNTKDKEVSGCRNALLATRGAHASSNRHCYSPPPSTLALLPSASPCLLMTRAL